MDIDTWRHLDPLPLPADAAQDASYGTTVLAGQSVKRYEWPRFSSERPSVDSNDPRRENLVAVGAATQRPKDDGGLVCLQCLYGPRISGFG